MQKCYYLRMEVRGEEVLITVTEKVRFVETDAMGVAHHSNYFRWFEMGRVDHRCRTNFLFFCTWFRFLGC